MIMYRCALGNDYGKNSIQYRFQSNQYGFPSGQCYWGVNDPANKQRWRTFFTDLVKQTNAVVRYFATLALIDLDGQDGTQDDCFRRIILTGDAMLATSSNAVRFLEGYSPGCVLGPYIDSALAVGVDPTNIHSLLVRDFGTGGHYASWAAQVIRFATTEGFSGLRDSKQLDLLNSLFAMPRSILESEVRPEIRTTEMT